MEYSLGDLADRLSILTLKVERIPNGAETFRAELNAVAAAFQSLAARQSCQDQMAELERQLYVINGQIWDLESDIRMGKDGMLGLEEVGRRAILIRNTNEMRIKIKNEINRISRTGFQESKSTWRV
jgi:hypothetical protein